MASYMPATAYGVTKSALASMTYGMATHFAADGIRVNGIAPGIMETPASKGSLPVETYARVHGSQMLNLHGVADAIARLGVRSEEHTSELQSLMRTSYAVFCLKQKNKEVNTHTSL